MRKNLKFTALPFFALLVLPQIGQAESLKDAMITAYLNNPALLAERASLRATDEALSQAMSGYRPVVSATGSFSYRHNETEATFASSGDTSPRNIALEVRQPIFRGLQTLNSTSEARNQVNAARERLVGVEQQILLQSVTAYMGVLRDLSVLELTINNVAVLRRQLEASEDRFRVGEITRTDVAQSKARLSRAISEKILAEATLTASRAAYRKNIGNAPADLEKPISLPAMPASEEAALEIGKANNPTLLGAQYTEKAARYNVKRQYGTLAPSVDIVARVSRSWQNFSDIDKSLTRQITAQLTVPIYQGGSRSSTIRRSQQINNQRRLEAVSAERDVVELVRNAWEGYREATARIVSSEDQVTANDIALEGVRQEAEVGSRTTLDVLDAEQELLDARVSLVRVQRDQFVAAYTLLSSIGKLTAVELQLDVTRYDPTKNTEKVKNKFYGWEFK